jgi:hypothetical protein
MDNALERSTVGRCSVRREHDHYRQPDQRPPPLKVKNLDVR